MTMTMTVTQPAGSRQSGRVSDVPDPEVPERARRRTCAPWCGCSPTRSGGSSCAMIHLSGEMPLLSACRRQAVGGRRR